MNRHRSWMYLVFTSMFIVFVFVGCGSETGSNEKEEGKNTETEQAVKDEDKDKRKEDNQSAAAEGDAISLEAPEPPKTMEEIIAYPSGPFAGKEYEDQQEEVNKALDELPPLQDETDEAAIQAYWAKLVSLFAEDYPDPADVVRRWGTASFGSPDIEDPKLQFKENYNVEIILDSSGSMAAQIGGKTMMQMAKEAIKDFAASLPEGANVALRVYGHKGSNADADKKISCGSNELVYPMEPYNSGKLDKALDKFKPTGWTPVARSLELAKEDLAEYDGKSNTNIIYLVSDGVETCDGDPVKAAKELADSNITPIVNVIGFDLDNEGQKQLKKVAEAADGTYVNVQNQDELKEELDRAEEIAKAWRKWKTDAIVDSRKINTERTEMLTDHETEWADKRKREDSNFARAFEYLQSQNLITGEVASSLYSFKDERIDLIYESQEQIWDDLFQLKEKKYSEMRQMIEEKYGQNVNE